MELAAGRVGPAGSHGEADGCDARKRRPQRAALLIDAKDYEKITRAFNLLKLLVPAEEDISAGRYKEAKGFIKKLVFKLVNEA